MQHSTLRDEPLPEGFLPRWVFHPWLRGFLASALTYAAAVGAAAWKGPAFNVQVNGQAAGPGDWWIVLLFTVSHAVIPVFFYRLFFLASAAQNRSSVVGQVQQVGAGCQHAFLYVHMSFWYGGPIIVLGAMTNWLSLLGFPIVLFTARRGERLWAFLEYGSSSMAMVLAVGTIGLQNVWGVLVVLVQSVLLGLTHVAGKKLWTSAPAAQNAVAAEQVKAD